MPGKAMKCIVEIDLFVVACPGTFLHELDYVYLHMEVLGLVARTKSVPPTFPLFFHQRLKFEKTFSNCSDPGGVASQLKSEDIILELRQHKDYATDYEVIAHCSSNTHDFLYPAISPYYGPGREILLYKTSKFKPIRVTGEPVKLEYSTKTVIKEVADYGVLAVDTTPKVVDVEDNTAPGTATPKKLPSPRSRSTPNLAADVENEEFVIRRKDDKVLSNRDFSTYVSPKPRRSMSPIRSASMRRSLSPRRSVSPTRSKSMNGYATIESLPASKYHSSLITSVPRHQRSITDPLYRSTVDYLCDTLEDLDLTATRRRHRRMYRSFTSPHVIKSLNSSKRIKARVDDLISRNHLLDSDVESDVGLDVLRESLREERNALNDAIKAADREAFYRTLNRTR